MTVLDQASSDSGKSVRNAAAYAAARKRVLVVDDERSARNLLSSIFAPPAFQCVTAASGEEALVALEQEPFEVVVSDLCMPGISGLSLINQVRRQRPHVAFLVTTGVDDVEVGIRAMQAGADDYLVKPVSEQVVLASVERALEKQSLRQQIEEYRHHLEDMVAERTAQLRTALEKIEQSDTSTLQVLGAAIDLRDSDTAGHSERVCTYALELATVMALPSSQLQDISRGAYLHDIGKLGVPDHVLLKPGRLTREEEIIMQRHVQVGFELVKEIPFLADAADIILTHHERFDGNGYPRGLKGQEIPIGGRIFALVDALDAITSNRPYQRATTFEVARDVIRNASGSKFDPHVVEQFLEVPEEKWKRLAESASGRQHSTGFRKK